MKKLLALLVALVFVGSGVAVAHQPVVIAGKIVAIAIAVADRSPFRIDKD